MSDKKGFLSFLNLNSIVENLAGYVEKRMALFKIELKEDLAKASAKLLIIVIISIAFIMTLLFLSIAGAILLNEFFINPSIGFFIVAGIYIIIFLIFYFLKDSTGIKEKFQKIFQEMLNDLDEENGNK